MSMSSHPDSEGRKNGNTESSLQEDDIMSDPPSSPSVSSAPNSMEGFSNDQKLVKMRKAYTITKQRENWSEEEHEKFVQALKLFDRDWKKIEKFIGSKTVIQIRSHAQKYFQKVQREQTGEHIPPPRPKRKTKKSQEISVPWLSGKDHNDNATRTKEDKRIPGSIFSNDKSSTDTNFNAINNNSSNIIESFGFNHPLINDPAAFAHWMASNGLLPGVLSQEANLELYREQQEQLQHAQEYIQQVLSASEQTSGNLQQETVGSPNFFKIYSFLGSLFDPSADGHMEALNNMNDIDKKTVQLLMHNLAINIANQQFREKHAYLLERYHSLTNKRHLEQQQQEQINEFVHSDTSNTIPNTLTEHESSESFSSSEISEDREINR